MNRPDARQFVVAKLSPTVVALSFLCVAGHPAEARDPSPPKPADERLLVELVAEHPQIVTPTGIAVDQAGRVFVAESHTHFRPDDYDGPKADRILIFADGDGDGRFERRHVFHEGFTHVMDIEFHHDGSLYVATRMDIHRLRDTDGDNSADEVTPIVKMETTGTYPHNGISGLAFEFDGSLHFGLGENLGHKYTLIGTDGTRISGGGEGGSTYHVQADGSKLRRVSTGWWNPFGMCVDAFGRVFGTDNDPGASPPCRLIQVFEGGDYGYEYRYGRTGLHPLISWTGDMPGTIPMIAGTGEAPCAIVAYESDVFPEEYRGQLLVASWADHRIERYPISQTDSESLVATRRETLVQGGDNFRPVGLAVAPDGSAYVSDWVSSSYTLHKQGRVWRIRPQELPRRPKFATPRESLSSLDRPTRERAARELLVSEAGRRLLLDRARHDRTDRVRATAIDALASVDDPALNLAELIQQERSLAVQYTALRHVSKSVPLKPSQVPPGLRHYLYRVDKLGWPNDLGRPGLRSSDPVAFSAAVDALAARLDAGPRETFAASHPVAGILALKRNAATRAKLSQKGLEAYLHCNNPDARFLAVKWIADDKLTNYRPALERLLTESSVQASIDVRLFLAVSAALDRLDGKKSTDIPPPDRLVKLITNENAPLEIRRIALRLVDPTFKGLKPTELVKLTSHDDDELRLEAIRTLAEHPSPERLELLAKTARDVEQLSAVRAVAVRGLSSAAADHVGLLVELAVGRERSVGDEALRSLIGVELSHEERVRLQAAVARMPDISEAVARIVDAESLTRPAADDWLALLTNDGNAEAGERVFFGTKVGTCAKCHQVAGRGRAVGPPLTFIGRRLREEGDNAPRWLLETLLEPGKQMAPQYTPWQIVTKDGKVLTGLPRRKGGNSEAYLGLDGKEFSVKKQDIEFHQEMNTSLMPKELLNALTRRELNDLFAFLLDRE